jgi:single-strand DNA-binding protein
MARGLNKVLIIGFAEEAPGVRHTAHGQAVSVFNVSTRRYWTTNSGETREADEWFSVVAWGELATLAQAEIKRGQRVFVEGSLQTRAWEDAKAQRHCRTEVLASRLILVDGRRPETAPDGPTRNRSMPHCLNQAMAIGNLGRDPAMRYTPDGQAVTSFSMAATHTRISEDGARRDSTEWFNVISWGSLAEICSQYLSRGRRVYVEGELRTRGWEQADGVKRFRTELVASEMILLGPRPRPRPETETLESKREATT